MTSSGGRILMLAAGLQVLVVLVNQLQNLVSDILRAKAGEGMTRDFRARMFRHLQRLSLMFHATKVTPEVTRVTMLLTITSLIEGVSC